MSDIGPIVSAGNNTQPPSALPDNKPRPFDEWQENGLLWLINATVFHPRGYALMLGKDQNGKVMGWDLTGDGTEPWQFASDPETQAMIQAKFEAVRRLLP